MGLFNSNGSESTCGSKKKLIGGRRRKTHRRRVRHGGNGGLSKLIVPASLYALKQLMEKKSSRKFVNKIDKSLGRQGKTVAKDVTKGVVGTVNVTKRVLGLRKRKSRKRKSRKRKSRR